ncbi:hypothetical protein OO013_18095 [Mangrovivirga sp. M17]|uniref:Uncharacterized protein n=1 Tax=Mangrovivirga halotolerans TaxID=2993936 RepID=A0ABT3RW04_9BACT|nr:hypothetical protein [Mangrovivirga halotolerans]MCX2745800.1 hypothetical protein [Mangrovivirga halotolerans]
MLNKILTAVFTIIAIVLAWLIWDYSINSEIRLRRKIKKVESEVIQNLEQIREAQKAYYATHKRYTENWDSLISFIDTGKIYIVERNEEIITLEYGADSVVVEYDTLGSVGVQDSLFNERKYPNFKLSELKYVPYSKGKVFEMETEQQIKGPVKVSLIQVVDPAPFDKSRKEDNDIPGRRPLRFGSLVDATLSGNWE